MINEKTLARGGEGVSKDAITTIRETEARARAIEEDAKVKAQEMIEETERSCIEFCEKRKES